MGAIATFVYADWVAQFPEMTGVSQPQATGYFARATAFLRNDGTSPVQDSALQTSLLYLLTSHVAWLNAPRDASGNPSSAGAGASPPVGRISNASEGSVSVALEAQYAPGTPQWFQQTRYGAEFWAATVGYRTMRYSPLPTIVADGVYPFLPGRGR